MRFVRAQCHAVQGGVPKTYCHLSVGAEKSQATVKRPEGPFCELCELGIGHCWALDNFLELKSHELGFRFVCLECDKKSGLVPDAPRGRDDPCPKRTGAGLKFVRTELHTLSELIPETYCGLSAPDELEDFGELPEGLFCERCEVTLQHNWVNRKEHAGFRCQKCGTTARTQEPWTENLCLAYNPVSDPRTTVREEDQAMLPKDKQAQWEQQVARLDKMIEKAESPQERERYEGWKAELEAKLRGETPAPRSSSNGGDDAYTRRSARVLEFIRPKEGEKVTWAAFTKATKLSGGKLGKVLDRMLQEGVLKEEPQYCYHVVDGGEVPSEPETGEPEQAAQAEEPPSPAPEEGQDTGKAEPKKRTGRTKEAVAEEKEPTSDQDAIAEIEEALAGL